MLQSLIARTPFLIRLLHWEYWPSQAIYVPLLPYFVWLAFRSRHPFFFSAANPSIYISGLGLESKFITTEKLPSRLRPKTILVMPDEMPETIFDKLKNAGISFPLIAKPDIGYRGFLVKKIESGEALLDYLHRHPIAFILQELIDLPFEVGVLYYRYPGDAKGKVTSITLKEFLHVVGDGHSKVVDLVKRNPRALLQLERLQDTHASVLELIPDSGQVISLGTIGNHSKGTKFIDGRHLINEALVRHFDDLNLQINEVYYGRFDLKCQRLEDLITGENLKIIELNGICSEPTHIYHPGYPYFKALYEVAQHWNVIARISVRNVQRGFSFIQPAAMVKAVRDLRHYFKYVAAMAAGKE